MAFTVRRNTETRLEDYKKAFRQWVHSPGAFSIVFVENSGFDLSELKEIAKEAPTRYVEFLSFKCMPFDGALGKGYGEMLCLEHCLSNSSILKLSPSFLKVTGRYYLTNASAVLKIIEDRQDTDIICNLLMNLTWADSRAFGGSTYFLKNYLCPMRDQLNDSQGSAFEQVLARAVHQLMANSGKWALLSVPLKVQGVSGSLGHIWTRSFSKRIKQKLRQKLLSRLLNSCPD